MGSREGSPSSERSQPDRLAQYVHRARENKQMSVADLARESGLPAAFIEAVERGEIDPSQSTLGDLEPLATALDVECADLLSG
jgi:ribosome-binding protein aMBF1 (putative translation factor)